MEPRTSEHQPSVIPQLRALMPSRPLTFAEALRIAELQAGRLLKLSAVFEPPVPEEIVLGLPRLDVRYRADLPVSGATEWVDSRWQITINASESPLRQRFSLFHELLHVVNHPFLPRAYEAIGTDQGLAFSETVCDYFAGACLMPRSWVKRTYFNQGVQDVASLAGTFDVSRAAMGVRLSQLGLSQPTIRCAGVRQPSSTHFSEVP